MPDDIKLPEPPEPDGSLVIRIIGQDVEINAYRDSTLRDYARAAVLADRANRWQPIEMAPRDGTAVLLCAPGRVTVGEWHAEKWPTASEYHASTGEYLGQHETGECIPAGWYSWDGGFTDDDPPTGWQPLPAPPEQEPTQPAQDGRTEDRITAADAAREGA